MQKSNIPAPSGRRVLPPWDLTTNCANYTTRNIHMTSYRPLPKFRAPHLSILHPTLNHTTIDNRLKVSGPPAFAFRPTTAANAVYAQSPAPSAQHPHCMRHPATG